ncbi:MAG: histidinol-phosphate transaminase [Verrucomicrobia bacterium]|nr:histidinol-phosphate transaminase [Verrucomicrobiota bacterium]
MKNPHSALRNPQSLVRPIVRVLHAYVPGEQPKIQGLIKLNTNENPYPPSPKVRAAIQAAVDGRLRLYPNPTAQELREKLAKLHRCSPENIVVGNGSDELLALATRTFVEPGTDSPLKSERARSVIQFFTPSYSLYPVLAAIHGAHAKAVPLGDRFALPSAADLRRGKRWDFRAALTFITTPNAPSGRGYATAELETLCRAQRGIVVLDEAYVDFANENALELGLRLPNVLVARTFSKAYSLCFLRVGYFVGHPDLIEALDKIRDSYNVNGLGQIGALATLGDLPYYRGNFRKVIATRERLTRELGELGFEVFPSQTNFLLARPPCFPAERWLAKLRARKILVRWFGSPEVKAYLRISIGTDREATAFLKAVSEIVRR